MASFLDEAASRRGVLGVIFSGLGLSWASTGSALTTLTARQLTPACGRALTAAETEGPFFKPSSPERSDLAAGAGEGVRLALVGRVLDACGLPVAGALIDVWQANAAGAYDRRGFVLRGHQFTDVAGRYGVHTIAPRWYAPDVGGPPPGGPPPAWPMLAGQPTSGLGLRGPPPFGPPPGGGLRTPHVHVKVQPPGGPLLTTQLFFPGGLNLYGRTIQPLNLQDGLFRPDLVIQLGQTGQALVGRFDFVVATSS